MNHSHGPRPHKGKVFEGAHGKILHPDLHEIAQPNFAQLDIQWSESEECLGTVVAAVLLAPLLNKIISKP